jgi:hypothetical protein
VVIPVPPRRPAARAVSARLSASGDLLIRQTNCDIRLRPRIATRVCATRRLSLARQREMYMNAQQAHTRHTPHAFDPRKTVFERKISLFKIRRLV